MHVHTALRASLSADDAMRSPDINHISNKGVLSDCLGRLKARSWRGVEENKNVGSRDLRASARDYALRQKQNTALLA